MAVNTNGTNDAILSEALERIFGRNAAITKNIIVVKIFSTRTMIIVFPTEVLLPSRASGKQKQRCRKSYSVISFAFESKKQSNPNRNQNTAKPKTEHFSSPWKLSNKNFYLYG